MNNIYFDAAISYAAPDIKIADEIYAALTNKKFNVFYDRGGRSEIKADMWGKYLDDYLTEIFRDRVRFCIILVSKSYINRAWAGVERKAARHRQIVEQREFILPISLDGSYLPNMEDDVHIHYHQSEMNADEISTLFSIKHKRLNTHHDIELSLSRLTPQEPQQSDLQTEEWKNISASGFNSYLNDSECAWILPFHNGEKISRFELVYHNKDETNNYDAYCSPLIRETIRNWGSVNQERYRDLEGENWGKQVRLSYMEYDDEEYVYKLHLEPIKYLHYVATHAKLWSMENRPLRENVFKNALHGLFRQEKSILPSHFCIHMAILSKDNEALLRQRRFHAELYPGAWEVGIGEFMHGIEKHDFPSFENNKPDLYLFLRNSVAEEIAYFDAKIDDFYLYGFAIEYRTLAPKLIVIYKSDLSINDIIDGAKRAKDLCQDAKYVKVEPEEIAAVMKSDKYTSWGPTSKLVLWLSMLRVANSEAERNHLNELLETSLRKYGTL